MRGKPSKMKPPAASSSNFSAIKPITISSVTNWPASITVATLLPISVPEVLAARNISPVDNCTMPRSSTKILAWVPLPAPGGPNRIMFIDALLHLFYHGVYRAVVISQAGLHTDAPANEIEPVGSGPYLQTQ